MRALAGAAILAVLAGCGSKPVEVPQVFKVKFYTTEGDFVVEARQDWARRGAVRFHELVERKYFDKGRFFRVVAGFIAQFGVHKDYDVHGMWRELVIVDDARNQTNARGTLAFAQSGPNTRAVEIFINLADNGAILDDQGFVPFARVVEGMDVVDRLYAGYGDFIPDGKFVDPGRVENATNAYLEPRFPEMDWIRKTEFLQ